MPGPIFARDGDVSLRTVEEADLEFLQANRNHPSIRGPLASPDPRNREQWQDVFENGISEDDGYHFLICDESGDGDAVADGGDAVDDGGGSLDDDGESANPTRVGVVAIPWFQREDDVGSLMYWTAPDHRGNGYTTNATNLLLDFVFRERGYHKVFAHVVEPNTPSIRVLEKLGFRQEGVLRAETLLDGEHVDTRRYGMLRREWLDL